MRRRSPANNGVGSKTSEGLRAGVGGACSNHNERKKPRRHFKRYRQINEPKVCGVIELFIGLARPRLPWLMGE
jgi:hypothetical protein